jgi:hypothetical protein
VVSPTKENNMTTTTGLLTRPANIKISGASILLADEEFVHDTTLGHHPGTKRTTHSLSVEPCTKTGGWLVRATWAGPYVNGSRSVVAPATHGSPEDALQWAKDYASNRYRVVVKVKKPDAIGIGWHHEPVRI